MLALFLPARSHSFPTRRSSDLEFDLARKLDAFHRPVVLVKKRFLSATDRGGFFHDEVGLGIEEHLAFHPGSARNFNFQGVFAANLHVAHKLERHLLLLGIHEPRVVILSGGFQLSSLGAHQCSELSRRIPVPGGFAVVGKSAWHRDAAGELATLVGAEGGQLEAAAQYYNSRLVNPKKEKMALEFVGNVQVRGKDALEVEVSSATGVKRQVFFDPETHLVVKEAATVGGAEEALLYEDYRAVEGVKLPGKIELDRGGAKYDITLTRAMRSEERRVGKEGRA